MKKKLVAIACLLTITLNANMITVAKADVGEDVDIACQYIAKNILHETIINGTIVDGNLYVSMNVIAEITDMQYIQGDNNLVSVDYYTGTTILYDFDENTGILTEVIASGFYEGRTWNIPNIRSNEGEVLVSLDHMLAATNTQISIDVNAEIPIAIYRPYTIIDARNMLSQNQMYFFEWTEVDSTATEEEIDYIFQLSALNALFLDYDSHLTSDALFAWWNDSALSANEQQCMDAMVTILTCFSDIDPSITGTVDYQTLDLQGTTLGLASQMMELLGVTDDVVKAMGVSSTVGEYALVILEYLSNYIMYQQISDVQTKLLEATFLSERDNTIFVDKELDIVKNAARHLQKLLDDSDLSATTAQGDAAFELIATAAQNIPPLLVIDVATDIVSILPGTSTLADINATMMMSTYCYMLELFAREEFSRINDLIRQEGPTEELLYANKQVLIFALQSSYAVRDVLIRNNVFTAGTTESLREKNAELLEYITFVSQCSTKVIQSVELHTQEWNELSAISQESLHTYNAENAVSFNGHSYCVYELDTVTSWEQAKQYCQAQGGYLATITSQAENDFLSSYIHQKGLDEAYFGLSRETEDWEWANGEELAYTNWESEDTDGGDYAMLYSERAQDIVSSVRATSEYTDEDGTYTAEQIADGDISTAWVEGADGQGIGESVTLTLDRAYLLSGFEINAGYQKNDDLYGKNSRPGEITITYSDGAKEKYTLEDLNDTQAVYFDQPIETDRLTIRLDFVYPGSTYADTAISEFTPIAYEQDSGVWQNGNFAKITRNDTNAFICEWGAYQAVSADAGRTTSDERDIVLVLDTSGSMAGTPLEETKDASSSFVDTVLEQDASIGIVTYTSDAEQNADFSVSNSHLQEIISNISSGGGTDIESGLSEANAMLSTSHAKQKIIVLMSDGEPNDGKVGEELIAYADQIKDSGITIYTLGFFESLGNKSSAQALMEQIASDGCHYEVSDADSLVFFFGDIADQINGQKYIYIRIACPVDVLVNYEGETLDSNEETLQTRTSFGTLTFEESEEQGDVEDGVDNRIKTLRLKDGVAYDIRIEGTARGRMDYTIGFMDDNGEYTDQRRFENIRISRSTVIDTVASYEDTTELNIDEDGDGKYDLKYRAKANEKGEVVDYTRMIYAVMAVAFCILVVVVVAVAKRRIRKRKRG